MHTTRTTDGQANLDETQIGKGGPQRREDAPTARYNPRTRHAAVQAREGG